MRISSEVKTGLIGVATILVIIWGVNFLKGRNILSSKANYYARYDHIQGLEPSANVMMKGYKVGTVERIDFDPTDSPAFTITLEIEKDFPVSTGSVAEIFNSDLLGTKAVRISPAISPAHHSYGDTLRSGLEPDMLSALVDEMGPAITEIRRLAITLDSAGHSLHRLLKDESLEATLANLEHASGKLSDELSEQGNLAKSLDNIGSITDGIRARNQEIETTLNNLGQISNRLNNSSLDSTMHHLATLSARLGRTMESIESGQGSLGKLIYSDSLYDQISRLSENLDSLVQDIRMHPEDYVRISVFGK